MLQEFYGKTCRKKEELETKLAKSKALVKKIDQLRASEGFLTARSLNRLKREVEQNVAMVGVSLDLSSQIRAHEERIQRHKVSISQILCGDCSSKLDCFTIENTFLTIEKGSRFLVPVSIQFVY